MNGRVKIVEPNMTTRTEIKEICKKSLESANVGIGDADNVQGLQGKVL